MSKENNDLLEALFKNQDKHTKTIPKGKKFFRARISDKDPTFNGSEINYEGPFEEYNSEDLGAPPFDKIKDGRANTKYVRYLYLSDSEYCAACEVRPSIGFDVIVGSGCLKQEINCYSFDKSEYKTGDDLWYLCHYFKKPLVDKKDYLVTQAITQYVKSLNNPNFDGIVFESAQFKYGLNLVLFEPTLCEITESKSFRINQIEYRIQRNKDSQEIPVPQEKQDICKL
jgi:hypothetical protein